jgi:predicted pyridoxine 5'-phosphate oxidase superfamily flavin-nucleotide-binding protein
MIKIDNNIKTLIESNPVSFATVDFQNHPNVTGVAFVKVVNERQLIITDNFMKQTKDNIINNDNVCLAVWDKDWNGYKIIGTAEYFDSGEWKTYVEQMPDNKGLPAKGAILMTITDLIKLN